MRQKRCDFCRGDKNWSRPKDKNNRRATEAIEIASLRHKCEQALSVRSRSSVGKQQLRVNFNLTYLKSLSQHQRWKQTDLSTDVVTQSMAAKYLPTVIFIKLTGREQCPATVNGRKFLARAEHKSGGNYPRLPAKRKEDTKCRTATACRITKATSKKRGRQGGGAACVCTSEEESAAISPECPQCWATMPGPNLVPLPSASSASR